MQSIASSALEAKKVTGCMGSSKLQVPAGSCRFLQVPVCHDTLLPQLL